MMLDEEEEKKSKIVEFLLTKMVTNYEKLFYFRCSLRIQGLYWNTYPMDEAKMLPQFVTQCCNNRKRSYLSNDGGME